ncbi:hypothetical protein [Pseudomonas syringae group genomosp. 7]|uniref:hypothetical protein n=1 Tax=Pseudomonas syringae group genomosp. 7 TaxID=251699 RepID=UPI00376F5A2A
MVVWLWCFGVVFGVCCVVFCIGLFVCVSMWCVCFGWVGIGGGVVFWCCGGFGGQWVLGGVAWCVQSGGVGFCVLGVGFLCLCCVCLLCGVGGFGGLLCVVLWLYLFAGAGVCRGFLLRAQSIS